MNRIHESESLRFGLANPDSRIYEVGFVIYETKQIFLESGFVTMIQKKSMFLRISYMIPASLLKTHLKSAHGYYKPFKSNLCDCSATRNSDLKRHKFFRGTTWGQRGRWCPSFLCSLVFYDQMI